MSSSKVIGIAGGIGSGKSTVTDYLIELGYPVYDGDIIAREAVAKGEPALKELTAFFGESILNEDGTLDRRKLARTAFADPVKTSKLNEILHGDIEYRIQNKLKKKDAPLSFISAPLFFEAGLDKICDETWAVIADRELRIQRTMERDQLPKREVEDRMARQMSDEERSEKADHTIVNNGSREELIKLVDKLL